MIFIEKNLTMLRGCLANVAKEDVRYYLKGLNITQTQIQGADGNRLGRFNHGMDAIEFVGIIGAFKVPASTVKLEIVKNAGKSVTIHQWTKGGVKTSILIDYIDGTYPNVSKVIENLNSESVGEIGIDAGLFWDIQKAVRAKGCKLVFNRAGSGVTVVFSHIPKYGQIIMPMRI